MPVTAARWLTAPTRARKRLYDVLGPCAALRGEVRAAVAAAVAPDVVLTFDAASVPAAAVWDALFAASLAGPRRRVRHRLVTVTSADALDPESLDRAVARYLAAGNTLTDTVWVLDSARPQVGVPTRTPAGERETRLARWEDRVRAHPSAVQILATVPSVESLAPRRGVPEPSGACRWLCTHLTVTQRQTEVLWSRCGADPARARDTLRSLGVAFATDDVSGWSTVEFTDRVTALLGARGAHDIAELILFGRRAEALAAVSAAPPTASDWARTLGYLCQRLDWLGPMQRTLRSGEELGSVAKRMGIHRRWVLAYADRFSPEHNIARFYDPARIARCRSLLARSSSALAAAPGVPPGFGEVLICAW